MSTAGLSFLLFVYILYIYVVFPNMVWSGKNFMLRLVPGSVVPHLIKCWLGPPPKIKTVREAEALKSHGGGHRVNIHKGMQYCINPIFLLCRCPLGPMVSEIRTTCFWNLVWPRYTFTRAFSLREKSFSSFEVLIFVLLGFAVFDVIRYPRLS